MSYDEEKLGTLLRRLPPAPEGWVRAAQELPAARAALDDARRARRGGRGAAPTHPQRSRGRAGRRRSRAQLRPPRRSPRSPGCATSIGDVSELPAWSLPAERGRADRAGHRTGPAEVTREWAWGGATGKGVRVCILDSGVDAGASARRPRGERRRGVEGRGRRARSSPTTSRATSAGTAPPAPGSSARSLRRPRSTASACSAPASPAAGTSCSPASATRSSRASTSST